MRFIVDVEGASFRRVYVRACGARYRKASKRIGACTKAHACKRVSIRRSFFDSGLIFFRCCSHGSQYYELCATNTRVNNFQLQIIEIDTCAISVTRHASDACDRLLKL